VSAPNPVSQPARSIIEQTEPSRDPLTDHAVIEFASVLDDFMDEEVVDGRDTVVGKLACYWQSVNGRLVFLGIKVKGHKSIRVVPGRRSQVDDRHACIRLSFDAADIESAPQLDCAAHLNASLERAVYDHFGIDEAEPHDGLQYFVHE